MKECLLVFLGLFAICSAVFAQEPRHQGWNVKGAIGWNPFSFDDSDDDDFDVAEAAGRFGLNSGIGYRGKGRWESRFNFDLSTGQVGRRTRNIRSPDTAMEFGVEPILHFRKNPPKWDPYLIITEIGFIHLFRNSTSGMTFGFPGLGLQHHLWDRLSLYTELKARIGLMGWGGQNGIVGDVWIPLGIIYRW